LWYGWRLQCSYRRMSCLLADDPEAIQIGGEGVHRQLER
jgi:hypothetical protein